MLNSLGNNPFLWSLLTQNSISCECTWTFSCKKSSVGLMPRTHLPSTNSRVNSSVPSGAKNQFLYNKVPGAAQYTHHMVVLLFPPRLLSRESPLFVVTTFRQYQILNLNYPPWLLSNQDTNLFPSCLVNILLESV